VATVLDLIDDVNADYVVLLGDNGELDPAIYEQVRQVLEEKDSPIQLYTYIHMIHPILGSSDQLFSEQRGYVTAMDLAAQMVDEELLAPEALTSLMLQLLPVWNHPSPSALKARLLPAYLSCEQWADQRGDSLYDLNIAGSEASIVWPEFVDSLLSHCRPSL
jgi:hypothetical protein